MQSVRQWWSAQKLQYRFMMIISAGLVLIAAGGITVIGASEFRGIEQKLRAFSQHEMASMYALVLGVMERRISDSNNVAIDVFNKWFEQRNKDYPGQLWSVWSPQVTAYMKRIASSRAAKNLATVDLPVPRYPMRKIGVSVGCRQSVIGPWRTSVISLIPSAGSRMRLVALTPGSAPLELQRGTALCELQRAYSPPVRLGR